MNETYVIYDSHNQQFYESYFEEEDRVFTNEDIELAYQFDSLEEAKRFADMHFNDCVILKWM